MNYFRNHSLTSRVVNLRKLFIFYASLTHSRKCACLDASSEVFLCSSTSLTFKRAILMHPQMPRKFDSARLSVRGKLRSRGFKLWIVSQELPHQHLRTKPHCLRGHIALFWHTHRQWISLFQSIAWAPDAPDGSVSDQNFSISLARSTRLASGSSCDLKSEKSPKYPWWTLPCCRSRCAWNLSPQNQRTSRGIWPHHKSRIQRDRTSQGGSQPWGCRCRTSSWTKSSQFECHFQGWCPSWRLPS